MNYSEEEIITKLKNLFQQCPILIFELNKILPKNNKLPLLNQENSDEFFEKLKNIDEDCYKEFIKVIVQYKDEDINIETLSKKVEDILIKYPELLEEAMLFIDHKKLNTNNYRKNNITKNNNTVISSKQNNANPKENLNSNENNQSGSKKEFQIKLIIQPQIKKSIHLMIIIFHIYHLKFKCLLNIYFLMG